MDFWFFLGFLVILWYFGVMGFERYERFEEDESLVYISGHDIRLCAVLCLGILDTLEDWRRPCVMCSCPYMVCVDNLGRSDKVASQVVCDWHWACSVDLIFIWTRRVVMCKAKAGTCCC